MRYGLFALATLALAACNSNTSPGADREAQVEPPATPAQQASAGAALAGVDPAVIQPENMGPTDVASLGARAGTCEFRMTEVGMPSAVYAPDGQLTLKLNGKLITLSSIGGGAYGDGTLKVRLRDLDGEGNAGLPEQELVLFPPGAPDERGYHGYRSCRSA